MKIFCVILFSVFTFSLNAQETANYSPEKHLRVADKLFTNNNCNEALKHVNKTIAARADDWPAYELRAMIYECLGKPDKALSDYSILVYQNPEHAEFLFSRGELNYRTGKYSQAIDDLNKALNLPVAETNKVYFSTAIGESGISGIATIKTMQAEMHNYIGLSYHELAQYDSAIHHFAKAIQLSDNVMYLNNRALSFEETGDMKSAIEDLEKALSIDENHKATQYNLFQLYGEQKNFEKQKKLLEKIDSDIPLPEIHIYKGVNYFQTGRYREALGQYDSAIMLGGESAEFLLYRGQANEKLKRFRNAKIDYEKALELKLNYPNAYFGMGNVYYKTNELDSALIFYDLAIHYDPVYYNAYLNRGIVYLRKKDFEAACRDISVAKNNNIKEAEQLYNEKCRDQ